jgi:hypothetical protein
MTSTAHSSAREQKRWTLAEWLEQKDRSRMRDLWLSFNSPFPYELMLGVGYLSYSTQVDSPVSEESHTSLNGDFSGLFHLRLLGNSIQDSYLNLDYGLRTRIYSSSSPETRLAQQFGKVSLQLYLQKHFGLDGHYRYFLPTTQKTLGQVKGDEWEGDAFIDFGPFRVFRTFFEEKDRVTAPGSTIEVLTDSHPFGGCAFRESLVPQKTSIEASRTLPSKNI